MASKLQEAAERHLIDSGLKHNNNFENHEVNEQVKIAFIVGSQYTEDIYKPKLAHSKEVIEELVKALEKIIEMNRQTALDQYGDAEKAESWSCVVVAREALTKIPK